MVTATKWNTMVIRHVAHNPATVFVLTVRIQLLLAVFAFAATAYARNDDFVAFFPAPHRKPDFFHHAHAFVAKNTPVPLPGFFSGSLFDFRIFAVPNA